MATQVQSMQVANQTYVWDEFGLFDQVMPEDQIRDRLTSCLRETMKFGIYPVFIVHGETSAFLPGSKGLVTVFLGSTVRLEAIGENVVGSDGLPTVRPTGRFRVDWLDGTWDRGQIPEWLTEEYLRAFLPRTGFTPVAGEHSAPVIEASYESKTEPMLIVEPACLDVEYTYNAEQVAPPVVLDRFQALVEQLTHESQAPMKSLVEWLCKNKGKKVSLDQVKGSWARNAGISRAKGSVESLMAIAKAQSLVVPVGDNVWKVSE
jgi:hypothetical protein